MSGRQGAKDREEYMVIRHVFFFSSRRRHTRLQGDWSSDVCSSDLPEGRDDSVFGLLEPELTVFHMHGDTYELPADAKNLARSALYEQQAFRWGDVVYGLQFHLEFTETMIQKLASEAGSRAYITGAGVDPQALVRGAATHVRRLGTVVEKVFSEFFAQCGL